MGAGELAFGSHVMIPFPPLAFFLSPRPVSGILLILETSFPLRLRLRLRLRMCLCSVSVVKYERWR